MSDVKYKIGIIGLGFVGASIQYAYSKRDDVQLLLIDNKVESSSYKDLVECDAVFIAVPSPTKDDGSCDTSILESVLVELHNVNYNNVIISKVTAPPQVYTNLQKMYTNLVHVPEFLTALNAKDDYINSKFCIVGGKYEFIDIAINIIKIAQIDLQKIKVCTIAEASLVKYGINCFLATKVVFMNELYTLSNALDCDYTKVKDMMLLDTRIGDSHMNVPGIDKLFGYGGMCFPKDTSSLVKLAQDVDVSMDIVFSAINKNNIIRNNN